MSSAIWTQCGGRTNLRQLSLTALRAVEGQQFISTRKLVHSDAEQHLLEELLEESKPRVPPEVERRRLHFLLFTPFRYPPLRHGSRFGYRHEPGIFYAAENERTVFAEKAYYLLLFLDGTTAEIEPLIAPLTIFAIPIHTKAGVDLTGKPFDSWRQALASKSDYAATQALGAAMREDGAEMARYVSARDVLLGANVAVFSPRAFATDRPNSESSWSSVATRQMVEFSTTGFLVERRSYTFPRSDFEVEGRLPAPAP